MHFTFRSHAYLVYITQNRCRAKIRLITTSNVIASQLPSGRATIIFVYMCVCVCVSTKGFTARLTLLTTILRNPFVPYRWKLFDFTCIDYRIAMMPISIRFFSRHNVHEKRILFFGDKSNANFTREICVYIII